MFANVGHKGTNRLAVALCGAVSAVALSCALVPDAALAADISQLGSNYRAAITRYDLALADQSHNAEEISVLAGELEQTQDGIEQTQRQLGAVATGMYRNGSGWSSFIGRLFECDSLHEALTWVETFEKIEDYYAREIAAQVDSKHQLEERHQQLEEQKTAIEAEVASAKDGLDLAKAALVSAGHRFGAQYHQAQGNGVNCGATSFIVAVNTLLKDNRFTDNVEVWEGPGFEKDSTNHLAERGTKWLEENELGEIISIQEVPGDVHTCAELAALLDQNCIVIISSGPESIWQRADGNAVGPDVFPDGHWIEFYHHESGIFFANDSSVSAAKGAGCPYTEEQLQQWLDGRSFHQATVLKLK